MMQADATLANGNRRMSSPLDLTAQQLGEAYRAVQFRIVTTLPEKSMASLPIF